MSNQVYKPGTALDRMKSPLVGGYTAYAKFQTWLVQIHYDNLPQSEVEKLRRYPPDAIEVIAEWAEAKDMEYRIDTMSAEQKALELERRIANAPVFGTSEFKDKSFEDLVSEEISLAAWLEVTDENKTYGPVLREVLNKQLQQAIEQWEGLVTYGYEELGEDYSHPEEFCDRRDELEYAAMGIEILRVQGYLQDLPYYDEYVKRLKEIDTPFRKLLNGETFPEPYADKTFWWRQK